MIRPAGRRRWRTNTQSLVTFGDIWCLFVSFGPAPHIYQRGERVGGPVCTIHGHYPDYTWSSVRQGRRVPGEPPVLPTHRPRRAPSPSRRSPHGAGGRRYLGSGHPGGGRATGADAGEDAAARGGRAGGSTHARGEDARRTGAKRGQRVPTCKGKQQKLRPHKSCARRKNKSTTTTTTNQNVRSHLQQCQHQRSRKSKL